MKKQNSEEIIKTGAKDVLWDLSSIYTGINDPQIDKDISEVVKMMQEFHRQYRGALNEKLDDAITDYSEIRMLSEKISVYLFLKQSSDVGDAVVKAKSAEADKILSQAIGEYLTFFCIEIIALDYKVLEKLYANSIIVDKHRPWIEQIRIFKPNFLSEPVESALTKRSPFGPGSWSEFFDEVESDLRFNYLDQSKSLTEMLHLLTNSKDTDERAEIMKIVSAGISGPFAKYSAQTLYMVVGSEAVEIKERGYRHPMESRNKESMVPDAVVDALHKAVMETAGPLARRFYQLKAAHLGMKTLKWSDRNAPMPFADTSIVPWEEAMKTVLSAYESFSPTLAEIIRNSSDLKRIDAPAIKGKRGGAYNYSIVLPGNKPASFTFLNYFGSNRDVIVLAHELGHGVHGMLAGEAQGPLMSHAPTAYCETASVFGEMTTFNFLKKEMIAKDDTEGLLALLIGKIDDILNTAVRQIGFSNFERRLHGMDSIYSKWGEPKKHSPGELNALWIGTLKELYGEEGEVFTYENAESLWTYIGHFHRPFYVYGYAFGELLTHSLYAKQEALGDRFEPLYLNLLRSGSTKNIVELLEPFGLDPTDENFWRDGIKISLGAMLAEAEQISKSIGITI